MNSRRNPSLKSSPGKTGVARICVFGKHRVRKDHILQPLGSQTPALKEAFEILYKGLKRLTDDGWVAARGYHIPGFNHSGIWLQAGRIVLVRMTTSADEIGRDLYPLILAVELEAVSIAFAAQKALPQAVQIADECAGAMTEDALLRAIFQGEEALSRLISESSGVDSEASPESKTQFLERQFGPARAGLAAVLSELSMQVAPGTPEQASEFIRQKREARLRVGSGNQPLPEAFADWGALLRSIVPSTIPIFLISSAKGEWIDILIGNPHEEQSLACLQTSLDGIKRDDTPPASVETDALDAARRAEEIFIGGPAPVKRSRALLYGVLAAVALTVVLVLALRPKRELVPNTPRDQGAADSPPLHVPQKSPAVPGPAPAPADRLSELTRQAQTAFDSGRFQEGLSNSEAGLKLAPSDSALLALREKASHAMAAMASDEAFAAALNRAESAFTNNQMSQAATSLNAALGLKPGNARALELSARLEQWKHATELMQSYTESMKAATNTLAAGNFNEALRQAEAARKARPSETAPQLFFQKIEEARTAEEKLQTQIAAALETARKELAAGRFDLAIEGAQAALKLRPNQAEAVKMLADAQSQKSAAAERERRFAIAMQAAQTALKEGKLDEAATNAVRALAVKNDSAALALQARVQESLAAWKKLLADASTALAGGQLDLAQNLIARALASNASSTETRALAVKIDHARKQREDFRVALAAAQKAFDENRLDEAIHLAGEAGKLPGGDDSVERLIKLAADRKQVVIKPPAAAGASPSAQGVPTVVAAPPPPAPVDLPPPSGPSFTNGAGMEFVLQKDLGAPAYVGRFEVTQKQFQSVMGRLPDRQPLVNELLPVINVSHADATEFCARLGRSEGRAYALPSRADWLVMAGISAEEMAAADVLEKLRARGALEKEIVPERMKRFERPSQGGSRGAAPNGLCDVLGNVREWTSEGESAGFSFDTEGIGERKRLFSKSLPEVTGFRCVLRTAPSP